MIRSGNFVLIPALALTIAGVAQAQDLRFIRRTGGYGALGFGGGNMTLTCSGGCPGTQLSSADGALVLGRHFGQRVRAELGLHYQSNREMASNIFTGSVGAAVYLLGPLHVRGGVTLLRASVEDTSGTYEGSGGPGFLVGAGYDLHLGRTFALTPYVNFVTGSVSNVTRTVLGGGTSSSSGSLKALNFGLTASFIRGQWECTTRTGERVRATPRNRTRALACLRELQGGVSSGPASRIKL